jgi:CRP/FNR family transcriptional regulator
MSHNTTSFLFFLPIFNKPMLSRAQLMNSPLKKLVRIFAKNEYVFRQGEPGNSMYLIVDGVARIVRNNFGVEHLVAMIPAGEMIGEKGILEKSPYRRNFTVIAASSVTLIEVDSDTLKLILAAIPDFHMRVLKMVLERLNKANRLTRLLQLRDPHERLIEYLIYSQEEMFRGLGKEKEIDIGTTLKDIQLATNLDKGFVQECIKELTDRKIVAANGELYALRDKNRLHEFMPTLRDRIAA